MIVTENNYKEILFKISENENLPIISTKQHDIGGLADDYIFIDLDLVTTKHLIEKYNLFALILYKDIYIANLWLHQHSEQFVKYYIDYFYHKKLPNTSLVDIFDKTANYWWKIGYEINRIKNSMKLNNEEQNDILKLDRWYQDKTWMVNRLMYQTNIQFIMEEENLNIFQTISSDNNENMLESNEDYTICAAPYFGTEIIIEP